MENKCFMKGNHVAAEAAIRAGCDAYFFYPLTPSSEVGEYMALHLDKRGGCFLQAESEIGSITMMLGGSAVGGRVMSATSGCGFSLMTEGLSYMTAMELPAVVVDVMRIGPGIGSMEPTQGDYDQVTKGCGHGGHIIPVYAPANVQEIADLTRKAFDVADDYRTPVVVTYDRSVGQLMESVTFSDEKPDKRSKPWSLGETVPHEPKILRSGYGFQASGNSHWSDMYDKYDRIENELQEWEEYEAEDAQILLAAFGSVSRACKAAVRKARAEGIKAGLLRPIAISPFPKKAFGKYRNRNVKVLTVEMNRGQMARDVRLALGREEDTYFYRTPNATMPQVSEILNEIRKLAKEVES